MHSSTFGNGGNSPSAVQSFAARNLQLLRAIETTVESLETDTTILNALSKDMVRLFDSLKGSQTEVAIDAEGRILDLLNQSMDSTERMHAVNVKRHNSACADSRLRPDDGVAEAYIDHLDALNTLHSTVAELAEWIDTHDALLEQPSNAVHSSADELFKALGIAS